MTTDQIIKPKRGTARLEALYARADELTRQAPVVVLARPKRSRIDWLVFWACLGLSLLAAFWA